VAKIPKSAEIEAFERATRRSRTIKLTVLGLVVLSPIIWVIYKNVAKRQEIAKHEEEYRARIALKPEDKKRLAELIASTRKELEESAAAFGAVTTPAALDALEDSGSPCGARVSPTFDFYKKGDPIDPGVKLKLDGLAAVEQELKEGKADKLDLEHVERMRFGSQHELFVVGEHKDPVVLANEYFPGTLSGFAYLYSHREKRVICFASFAVQNAESIAVEYRAMRGNVVDEEMKKREAAQAKLAVDLQDAAREAIAARLHATLTPALEATQ
jgi:hypothetical protein